MRRFILLLVLAGSVQLNAQNPFTHYTEATEVRYSHRQPVINYYLSVDTVSSLLSVRMTLRNVPDSFQVAMFVHPEYDDRYYRFIEALEVHSKSGKGSIEKKEPTLWKVHAAGNEKEISYNIRLPKWQTNRGAWRSFVSSEGSLMGGPHSYLYVVGSTLAPSYVHLEIPTGWKITTGLQPTSDQFSFFAPTVSALVDAPIFAGNYDQWNFSVDGVPHKVIYWQKNKSAFDTSLVTSIRRLVEQSALLFGRLPYKDYHFILQDESYGGLEHCNSVTLGINASNLKQHMDDYLSEIAHEYFHTWNLMRIRPVEYGDAGYRKQALSKGLWWSEGLTLFYADLLLRRAGLVANSRQEHLQEIIKRYFDYSGHYKVSAEKVSMAAYAEEGYLGDYTASVHLQGEFLGTMLDFFVRQKTGGKKSMDDVMRLMMQRFGGSRGFTSHNIEAIVEEVSGADISGFFADHVRGNKPVDVNKWLALIGLKADIEWRQVVDEKGEPLIDRRIYAWPADDMSKVFLGVGDPESCWAKAGLHTNDVIKSINKTPIKSTDDFYKLIRTVKIGDQVAFEVIRENKIISREVTARGYNRPEVKIEELNVSGPLQIRLRKQWMSGL